MTVVGRTLPIYARSPLATHHAMYLYEMECGIIGILRNAQYDRDAQYGWMIYREILDGVNKRFDDGRDHHTFFDATLSSLVRKGVVLKSDRVLVAYIKNRPKENGFVEAYKLENDSDYRPKKPRRFLKSGKQKLGDEEAREVI